jgi:nucleotide-binding universal stress UspA family protein
MLKTILVAVDSSAQHPVILDQAAEVAIATGADVHVATVADAAGRAGMALNRSTPGVYSALEHETETVLKAACVRLSDRGVPCRTHALNGLVAEQLILLAKGINADLIVMGHRHLSWMQKIFENSVGHNLLDRSPCNVLVVMEGSKGE